MSKQQHLKHLYTQIERINTIIDRKIMLGRTYRAEARHHRALLNRLRRLRNPSFFGRISTVFDREYA